MGDTTIALLALGCSALGLVAGTVARAIIPQSHLHEESKDVIKAATGLIATLVALVLGLLVASSKSTFDSTDSGINAVATRLVQLDRTLVRYGPETAPLRELLRHDVRAKIDQYWPADGSLTPDARGLADSSTVEEFQKALKQLAAQSDDQRMFKEQAVKIALDVEQLRWQTFMQSRGSLPTAFLVILCFWLGVLFASLGLLAPRNLTAYSAVGVSVLSVACAIFLILEMNEPLEGIVRVSGAPLERALEIISKP